MAHTLGYSPLLQNQLQFNLHVEPRLANIANAPKRPGPIMIEKLGSAPWHIAPARSLRVSAVSDEEMEMAVRLAKRDLRKKRAEIEMEEYMQHLKERAHTPQSMSEKKDKNARKKIWESSNVPRQTKQTQTRPKAAIKKKNAAVLAKNSQPARSDSPPTRDTDSYPPQAAPLTADEKSALEIRRLRKELKTYVDQINRIDTALITVERPRRSKSADRVQDEYTDEELRVKQMYRAAGHATRSSRMVYDLKQQVRAIYNDIKTMQPSNVAPKKKTDAINRLAAAHRATVRALQDLMHQLPYCAGHGDLARLSAELTTLIQQLTECCAQLEIGGVTAVPDSVIQLINKNPDIADVWNDVIPKPTNAKMVRDPVVITHVPPEEINIKPRDNRRHQHVRHASDGHTVAGLICHDLKQARTPVRDAALREGLTTLLKDRESSPGKYAEEQKSVQHRAPVPWSDRPSVIVQAHTSKSVLVPHRSKKYQQSHHKPASIMTDHAEPHYSQPTISTQIKLANYDQKNHRGKLSPKSPRRAISPHTTTGLVIDEKGLKRLDLGHPNEWVQQAEHAIRQRLQPLIDQAERLSNAYTRPTSVRHVLLEKGVEKVEASADLLVDCIIDDLMQDTAREMMELETDGHVDEDAAHMMFAPDLEVMLQTLNDLEREQGAIRNRWNTISYNSIYDPVEHQGESVMNTQPRSPEPILLTDDSHPVKPYTEASPRAYLPYHPRPKIEKSPIIFTTEPTATRLRSEKLQNLRLREVGAVTPVKDLPKPLTLTPEEIEAIEDYTELYDDYLRRTTRNYIENFNPWKLAESLSDVILDEFLDSFAQEMMANSSEMENQICMQELTAGQNIHLTDTDDVTGTQPADVKHVPSLLDLERSSRLEDSYLDLHDFIYDNENELSYHDDRRQGDLFLPIENEPAPILNSHDDDSDDKDNYEQEGASISYQDDRRQGEVLSSGGSHGNLRAHNISGQFGKMDDETTEGLNEDFRAGAPMAASSYDFANADKPRRRDNALSDNFLKGEDRSRGEIIVVDFPFDEVEENDAMSNEEDDGDEYSSEFVTTTTGEDTGTGTK